MMTAQIPTPSMEMQTPPNGEMTDDLEALLCPLGDGLDHPDIWASLKELGASDTGEAHIAALREGLGQFGKDDARIRNLALAVLIAATGKVPLALEALHQMESQYALCPQVAGALFFVSRMDDPERSSDLSNRFCEAPFVKFETLIDGTVAPCCSIWTKQRLGHLEKQNFDEIWNSEEAIAMRESILDGSYRYCNKQRCALIVNDDLPERDAVEDPSLRDMIDNDRAELAEPPKWLFLAHDVTCNLACPSCRGDMIVANEEQEARFSKIEEQVFFPLLDSEDKIRVSLSGQGDPFSSQHYRSILRHLAENDVNADLNLFTNALLLGEKRWEQYRGLEKYRPVVDVSIDACTPWVYEYVRRPGKWENLAPNLEFIANKRDAEVFREFHLNATIQLDNYHEIPALIDYATTLNATSVRFYMIQNTGGHLAVDYPVKNIADDAHPLHMAFLETLRDPKLASDRVHMYDVSTWRETALKSTLPSDALPQDYSYDALAGEILQHLDAEDYASVVALCAAGRIRFPDSEQLLLMEATALRMLRFDRQADYRQKMAAALKEENCA